MNLFLIQIFFLFSIFTSPSYSYEPDTIYGTWRSPKPIHLAVLKGDIYEVERILKDDPSQLEARDGSKYTPIYYAISACKDKMVKLLISKGANVNVRSWEDSIFSTPLIFAIHHSRFESDDERKKRIEIFRFLVDNGADYKSKASNGKTVMHIVASTHLQHSWQLSRVYIEILISYGADINGKDEEGHTPLHHAVHWNNVQVAETLVNHGADVNASNSDGSTPLHIAAKGGFDILKYLLSKNTNVDAKTNKGMTPLMVALDFSYQKSEHGRYNSELKRITRKRIDVLLDSGASVNIQDNEGKTPLHYAVLLDDEVIIKKFLHIGADITIKDTQGNTPVDYARFMKNQRLIDLFNRG